MPERFEGAWDTLQPDGSASQDDLVVELLDRLNRSRLTDYDRTYLEALEARHREGVMSDRDWHQGLAEFFHNIGALDLNFGNRHVAHPAIRPKTQDVARRVSSETTRPRQTARRGRRYRRRPSRV